jgi:hypothetical protein
VASRGGAATPLLAEREGGVVGLARADKKADRPHPVFPGEGDLRQVAGGLLAFCPLPSLVDDRRVGRPPDRCHDLGMTVAERGGRVARVDHLAAAGKLKPDAVATHDPRG